MLAGKTPYYGFKMGVIVGAIIALTLAALTTKSFFVRKETPINKPFLTEGFASDSFTAICITNCDVVLVKNGRLARDARSCIVSFRLPPGNRL